MRSTLQPRAGRAKRWALGLIGAALLAAAAGCGLVQEGKAWYYGVQAYVYGFPLIVMDLTKEAGTAAPTAGEFTAPVNQFSAMTHYPDASFRAVPRTGLDTLFAVAWADLDKEPLVLSVPACWVPVEQGKAMEADLVKLKADLAKAEQGG